MTIGKLTFGIQKDEPGRMNTPEKIQQKSTRAPDPVPSTCIPHVTGNPSRVNVPTSYFLTRRCN